MLRSPIGSRDIVLDCELDGARLRLEEYRPREFWRIWSRLRMDLADFNF
jgi:hypothetical protein